MAQLATTLRDHNLTRQAGAILLAICVGVMGGLAVVLGNPLVPFAVVITLVALPWLVTRPLADLGLVIAAITLLPFAVLPVHLAFFTPTLLEICTLLLYVAWLLRALLAGEAFVRSPLDGPILLFVGCTIFAFVLGLSRDFSTELAHNYSKMLLSIGLFFAVVNLVRTQEAVALVLRLLIGMGGAVSALGLVLYRLPDTLAGSLLTRLSVIGYPTDRVIRYIEDDPTLGERAVSTQVDPNSFGGMLVVLAVVTGVALLSRKPLMPRWLLCLMLAADLGALLATQSRSAFVAVIAAALFVGTLRYRKLWRYAFLLAVALWATGLGSRYFSRLVSGVLFQDASNLQRLNEYQNSFAIIAHYPAFGVGFGSAGELDLTTGVSSLYLTIAERAGLLGLALFLLVMALFFINTLPALFVSLKRGSARGGRGETRWSVLDTGLLGSTAAIVGALVASVADHFYFNIEFAHMVALFWLIMGLALVSRRLLLDQQTEPAMEHLPSRGAEVSRYLPNKQAY